LEEFSFCGANLGIYSELHKKFGEYFHVTVPLQQENEE
jgi:hypothetical protein